jgi:hypothetical protein
VSEFTDGYGNYCQRLIAPPGEFRIHAAAEVMLLDKIDTASGAPCVPVQDLPDSVLSFILPSRYCESDRFYNMASELTLKDPLSILPTTSTRPRDRKGTGMSSFTLSGSS